MLNRQQLWKALNFAPHSIEQREVMESDVRFQVFCCGRRWGKSKSAGTKLTEKLFKPDSRWWIVGPTYELGEREFRVVHDNLRKLGILSECQVSYAPKSGQMQIKMPPPINSIVRVVSADKPTSLLGEALDGAIMSEAAQHDPRTWTQYIRPTLADKGGVAWFPSTPRGFNWFYELFTRGSNPNRREWASWRLPSWTNKIVFPEGRQDPEILEMETAMSEMEFAQEVGASFTTFQGRIYDDFDERIHVRPFEYNPLWKTYWAFDFGYTNPFVCLDIQVDNSDRVWVWREYYERHKPPIEHANILRFDRDDPPDFRVQAMFADPAGASEIASMAPILGVIHARAREVTWTQGIETVKRQLKIRSDGTPGLFIHPRCINLIRELNALRLKETTQFYKNPREGQHDYDDHAADALRYFHVEFFILGAGGSLKNTYKFAPVGAGSAGFFQFNDRASAKLTDDPRYVF